MYLLNCPHFTFAQESASDIDRYRSILIKTFGIVVGIEFDPASYPLQYREKQEVSMVRMCFSFFIEVTNYASFFFSSSASYSSYSKLSSGQTQISLAANTMAVPEPLRITEGQYIRFYARDRAQGFNSLKQAYPCNRTEHFTFTLRSLYGIHVP
jgi:hypothetical protein